MGYFMGEFSQGFFKPSGEKRESELKNWGSVAGGAAVTGGVLGGLTVNNNWDKISKKINPNKKFNNGKLKAYSIGVGARKGAIKLGKASLTGYGIYRAGKYLLNRNKNNNNNFSLPVEKSNAEFQFNIAQKVNKFGNTRIGKVFLKDADSVLRTNPMGKSKLTHGIAMSGKRLRKTPFAVAGVGLAGYGAYRAKKTYDKYKPVINVGRKLNNFLNGGN